MQVILLKNVEKLGKEGDTVKVKDGYAKNLLLPRKLAVEYSQGALKNVEERRRKLRKKEEKEKNAAEALAKRLSELSLTITTEAGVNDTLFGSVTSEMIHNALRQEGVEVDKKSITISEPIRQLGIYTIEIKLHREIKGNVKVWIVKK